MQNKIYSTFAGMYSRHEVSRLKDAFWTALGQYLSLHTSSEGLKINWLNYKTGEKNIYFKMHADKERAYITIELAHSDPDIQQIYFEQFMQYKTMLHQLLGEEWSWKLHTGDEHGKQVSRIMKELHGSNVFNKENWPELISFFKPRMITLDKFWNEVKYSFEAMR